MSETKMNTYDLCLAIRKRIVNKAAMVMAYKESWSEEFQAKEMGEIESGLLEADGFHRVDPNDLTSDQMKELGFGMWDEESGLMLIPLWLFPFIADEIQCGSISNADKGLVKRSDMDNDVRFGCIAHGVVPTK
jgi:hypothetical protein